MAKFRRNHTKSGNFLTNSFTRVVAFLMIGGFALYYVTRNAPEIADASYEVPSSVKVEERFYLPTGSDGTLVHHPHYSLSYSEKHEQADWVAYPLTKEELLIPNVERIRSFNPDYSVPTGSAFHRDYTRSGYTRGHLAPAGDMAFSVEAMKSSFLMSNISPQIEEFNGGIWRELEESVRDWAFDNEVVYVVTGPVLSHTILKKIGENKVSVPLYFFKVVLDIRGKQKKGIGFILKNELSEVPLEELAVTIDSVEHFTGFDFFNDLMDDELEESLESKLDVDKWRFSKERYHNRNKRYN